MPDSDFSCHCPYVQCFTLVFSRIFSEMSDLLKTAFSPQRSETALFRFPSFTSATPFALVLTLVLGLAPNHLRVLCNAPPTIVACQCCMVGMPCSG